MGRSKLGMGTVPYAATMHELLKYLEADGITGTVQLLEQRCSDEDLLQISRDLVEWRNVAPHLGLSDTDLEDIEEARSEQERRLKALKKWRRKAGFTATYKKLVSAFLEVGDTELAEKICRQLHRRAYAAQGNYRQRGAAYYVCRRPRRRVFVFASVCVLCLCVYASFISYNRGDESKHRVRDGTRVEMAFPPVEFIMEEFEQHKKFNAEWFSKPFYTHPRGYKMCLSVNAKGWGDGEGTHNISVYVHLMKGEFDDNLKWPFRGDITVQLLNQLEDREHYQDIFSFSNSTGDTFSGRVTTGERGAAWGNRRFISHFQLPFNAKKNRQYLKDSSLCFRVSKVVIHNTIVDDELSSQRAGMLENDRVIQESLCMNRIGEIRMCTGKSCKEILEEKQDRPSGYYWLKACDTCDPFQAFCDFNLNLKGTKGWMRVADLDMTHYTQACPSQFKLITSPKRLCGKKIRYGCDFTTFEVHNIRYKKVAGRVLGYGAGTTHAFTRFSNCPHCNIDKNYVEGVSITHGYPRRHIWTYAVGHDKVYCPCVTGNNQTQPQEVGNDYYCEVGEGIGNLLWDGEGCSGSEIPCCLRVHERSGWFIKELNTPTANDIEVRLCADSYDEDIRVERIELYVQ